MHGCVEYTIHSFKVMPNVTKKGCAKDVHSSLELYFALYQYIIHPFKDHTAAR